MPYGRGLLSTALPLSFPIKMRLTSACLCNARNLLKGGCLSCLCLARRLVEHRVGADVASASASLSLH